MYTDEEYRKRKRNYNSEQRKNNKKRDITLGEMTKYFSLTVVEAAKAMHVSQGKLKKSYRSYGLRRWPFKTICRLAKASEQGCEACSLTLQQYLAMDDSKPSIPELLCEERHYKRPEGKRNSVKLEFHVGKAVLHLVLNDELFTNKLHV